MSAVAPTRAGDRRRWIALGVVCMAMLMNTLDGSVVNVALPVIQRDLHIAQANLTWVINAYLITFGSFLLLAGRLGDLVGRKRVFLSGVTLFTLASALCGLAEDQNLLIAARFVQGLGGAVSSSVIIAMIVTEFPEPAQRAKAMSAYIFVAVGGGSIGLLVGGVVTQTRQLALDLLHQHPDRPRHAAARPCVAGGERGHRTRQGRRRARLDRRHGRADARHLRHRLDPRPRLGVGPHAALRRRRGRPDGDLLHAAGAPREPDHAAAHPARARAREHEHRARPARDRPVLDLLPRRPLPGARARLQRAAHGRRLPAPLARGRRALDRHHREPDEPLRPAPRDAPRPRADGRRAAADGAPGRALELFPDDVLRPADPRHRRRHRLHPVARDRDGERPERRRRPRLGHRQRLAADVRGRSASPSSARSRPITRARSRADGHSLPNALTGGYQLAFLVGAACVALGAGLAFVLLRPPPAPPPAPAEEPAPPALALAES